MNLESLVARLDVLESQNAIRGLKAAYMQACDDRRGGAIADLFWDDGIWEGVGGASGRYDKLKDQAFEYSWMLSQVGIVK